MTAAAMKILPAPVRSSVTVKVSQARAFEVFTASFSSWWPSSHKIGAAPYKFSTLEPRAGGRWYETGEDGSECDWGEVLEWEPPHRIVLAWRIGMDWQFDPNLLTEVEVRFTPQGDGSTLVELEHRKLENMGAQGEAARQVFESQSGWRGILQRFKDAAEEQD
jgi:uncharacterized protein YndB with AHSA1/START domain